jgi:nodulation protein E
MHRVAITGLGCVSALGLDVAANWESLAAGRPGLGEITLVPPETLNTRLVGEVKGFDPQRHFDDRQNAMLDRFSQLIVVAAREAVKDAGLILPGEAPRRTAVITGIGLGGVITMDEGYHRLYARNMQRNHPLTIPRLMPSASASQISMDLGITGPAFSVTSACASSNHALGEAFWMVRSGRVEVALGGGSEAPLSYGSMRAWEALRVLASDACRPFCKERRGMVLGEGGGIVVLENWERAKARGARIYAEFAGFGMSADAGDIVQPSAEGAAAAMTDALQDAGLAPEQVGYINAHGTGTQINDVVETRAIRTAFGKAAEQLAISSTKSMHGHALGGAGAIEMVALVKAVQEGLLPPTANFLTADPACDLDYVPNEARRVQVEAALSNSFAFGGLNAVVAVKRAG